MKDEQADTATTYSERTVSEAKRRRWQELRRSTLADLSAVSIDDCLWHLRGAGVPRQAENSGTEEANKDAAGQPPASEKQGEKRKMKDEQDTDKMGVPPAEVVCEHAEGADAAPIADEEDTLLELLDRVPKRPRIAAPAQQNSLSDNEFLEDLTKMPRSSNAASSSDRNEEAFNAEADVMRAAYEAANLADPFRQYRVADAHHVLPVEIAREEVSAIIEEELAQKRDRVSFDNCFNLEFLGDYGATSFQEGFRNGVRAFWHFHNKFSRMKFYVGVTATPYDRFLKASFAHKPNGYSLMVLVFQDSVETAGRMERIIHYFNSIDKKK